MGMASGLEGFVGANLSLGGDGRCRLDRGAWHRPGLFLAAAAVEGACMGRQKRLNRRAGMRWPRQVRCAGKCVTWRRQVQAILSRALNE